MGWEEHYLKGERSFVVGPKGSPPAHVKRKRNRSIDLMYAINQTWEGMKKLSVESLSNEKSI